jgi:hypothetical protein
LEQSIGAKSWKGALYILALLIIVTLSTNAQETDTIYRQYKLGDYNVSFETYESDKVSIENARSQTLSKIFFDQYTLYMENNDSEAVIWLYKYEKVDPKIYDNKTWVRKALEKQECAKDIIEFENRAIDDHKGIIGTCDNGWFVVAWTIDGTTSCGIISNRPWDEGTTMLLDTIHIEKSKEIPIESTNMRVNIGSIKPTTYKKIEEYISNPRPEYFIGSVNISVVNTGSKSLSDVTLSIGGMGLILIDSTQEVSFSQSIKGVLNSDYSLTWEIGDLLGSEKKELILTFVAWENFTTIGGSIFGFNDESGYWEFIKLRHKPPRT